VAATAGALILGALPRILRFERARDALLMGLGLAILANSRPYEGFLFSLPVAAVLLSWLFKKKGARWRASMWRVAAPLSLALVLAALASGFYFWRVTGNPFLMPQKLNRDTYAAAPYFVFQSPKPIRAYHHEALRYFYEVEEYAAYGNNHSIGGAAFLALVKALLLWIFFLGPALTLPLVMAIAILPRGWTWAGVSWETRFLILAGAIFFLGLALEVFLFAHYAAPATCLIFAMVLLAMRHLRHWQWRKKPMGLFIARAVPVICFSMLLLRVIAAAPIQSSLQLKSEWPETWYSAIPVKTGRANIEAQLNGIPGNHLVFVLYKPRAGYVYDWVHNEAEIDRSRIVWARDMGAAQNQELIDYFKDRHVWLADPAGEQPKITEYPAHSRATGE
jgi:hypothetical protein